MHAFRGTNAVGRNRIVKPVLLQYIIAWTTGHTASFRTKAEVVGFTLSTFTVATQNISAFPFWPK